jgi:hypothetical protein
MVLQVHALPVIPGMTFLWIKPGHRKLVPDAI